ncbi:hypothetical protein ACFL20_03765 [Spirochaetota bacterium]
MKKSIVFLFSLFILLILVSCKSGFLGDVVNFEPNRAPRIIDISSNHEYTNDLNASQVYEITIQVEDVDSDSLIFNFKSDIGTFSNQTDEWDGCICTSRITYTLPDTIQAGFNVNIGVDIRDNKGALVSTNLDLGSASTGLVISLTSLSGLYIQPDQDIDVEWVADNDGYYQKKLVDETDTCTIDESIGFKRVYANTPDTFKVCGYNTGTSNCYTRFSSTDEQKKLCIIVRDDFMQDSILTATVASDSISPVATINPEIDGGIYPTSKTVSISCSDNFS